MSATPKDELTKAASEQSDADTWSEMMAFLRERKKWWLLPILLVLVLFAVLLILSGSGVAPFIYTIF